jgi:D-lactate dehydrogenase
MNIVFFDVASIGVDRALVADLAATHAIEYVDGPLTPENAAQYAHAHVVSVFVSSRVPKEVIDALPNLKCIAARSTGLDHIDSAHAQSKGIAVTNVAGYGEHTVAEFTFAMLFALTRKIPVAHDAMRSGRDFNLPEFVGSDLYGKTIAVIGTGRIGKRVIEIARAFGMTVVAYDVFKDEAHATTHSYKYAELDEAVSVADIVSLHAPYLPQTHHMINAERIARMKDGVLLVNTARGELVDAVALVAALTSGKIAAAALDVLEDEKKLRAAQAGTVSAEERAVLEADLALLAHPRVIVTPHIAFCSQQAIETITRSAINSITTAIL